MSRVESRYHPLHMRIALAQNAPLKGEIDANLRGHLQLVDEAVSRRVDLIIFPELSLTGYDVREQATELSLAAQSPVLRPLVEASRAIDIQLGFIEQTDDFRICNSAAYLANGELRHVHRKTYLPTYGRFDEGRYFAPGDTVRAFDLFADESGLAKASGRGQLRVGAMICEELWHPSVSWLLGQDGAQLLLVQAAASNVQPGSPGDIASALRVWEALAVSAAVSSGTFLVLVNRVGAENGFYYFGSSFAVDPRGRVMARAGCAGEELLVVEIDFTEVAGARISMPLQRDERLDLTARELDRIARARFQLDSK